MKSKTATVLIVLLLACTGYIAIRHLSRLGHRGPQEPGNKNVLATEPGKVKVLTILSPGRATVRFEAEGDAWNITQPFRWRAIASKVDDLLDDLRSLEYEEVYRPKDTDAPGDDLSHLDQPLWKVRFTNDKAATQALHVGAAVPLSGGAKTYVRPAGQNKTYVVGVDLAAKLAEPIRQYRDKTIWDLGRDKIVKVAIEGAAAWQLHRDKDGEWGLIGEILSPADAEEVKKLLDKIKRIEADEFVADDPKDLAPFGLGKGQRRLIVRVWTLAKGPAATQPASAPAVSETRHRLVFGSRSEDKVFAKVGGRKAVFKLDAALLKDLQPKASSLRDKTVLGISVGDIADIHLTVPGGTIKLSKKDGRWEITAPTSENAAAEQVNGLLEKIAALKATGFRDEEVSPSAYGLARPRAVIRLHQAAKGSETILKVGSKSPSGEMTFVKSSGAKAVAVVPSAQADALLADPAVYHDPVLVKLPAGTRITHLTIKRPDETFELSRDEEDNWRLTRPLKADADADNVNTILDLLEELTATKVVAADRKVPLRYAKAADQITVEFTWRPPAATTKPTAATKPTPATQPRDRTGTVHLVKMDDEIYGWVAGARPACVGQFAAKLYEQFCAEVRSGKVLVIKKDQAIRQVKITAGEDTLTLDKHGERWSYTADPDVPIDGQKVAEFLETLEELTAEKFASHTKGRPKRFGLDKPWVTVELTGEEGSRIRILVSAKGTHETKNRYATASGIQGVFVLPANLVGKLALRLKDFKKQVKAGP